MKHPTLLCALVLITFSFNPHTANTQITLDTEYVNGGKKLFMVELESSGMKYVEYSSEQNNRYLKFYHLDHSLWKTIDCNGFPTPTFGGGGVQYFFSPLFISEHLFDCDDDIEFMYFADGGDNPYTGIYKEDGTLIFDGVGLGPYVLLTVPQQYRPIYSTPEGTKMILSQPFGDAFVFDLPCELSTDIDLLMSSPFTNASLSIYPNPAYYEATIAYDLPEGIKEGEIILHDIDGREIERYTVDRTFNELKLSYADITAGTYLYSLLVDGLSIVSKQLIVLEQ